MAIFVRTRNSYHNLLVDEIFIVNEKEETWFLIDWLIQKKTFSFIYWIQPTTTKRKNQTMDRSQLTVIPNKTTSTTSTTNLQQQQQQSQLNRPKTSSQASTTIITNTNTNTTTTTIDLSLTLCHLLQRILIPFTLATGKFLIIIIRILKTNFLKKNRFIRYINQKNWSEKKLWQKINNLNKQTNKSNQSNAILWFVCWMFFVLTYVCVCVFYDDLFCLQKSDSFIYLLPEYDEWKKTTTNVYIKNILLNIIIDWMID